MDVVWMEQLQNFRLRINNKGQSAVEYILLLAVISSISYAFFNNQKFKEFFGKNSNYFTGLQQGMAYSYRYGRELKRTDNYEQAMSFNYSSPQHDTYYDNKTNKSRFFTGQLPYGGGN